MEYFIVAGLSSWRSSPLTWVWIRSSSNGGISSIGTSHGPIEPVFGQFLPWVTLNFACRTQSRIVPSLPSDTPAMWDRASATGMRRPAFPSGWRPMTTTISPS